MDATASAAIIAAVSALGGAAIGQCGPVVQHWLSARRERRALLRQKYEEMAALALDIPVLLSLRAFQLRHQATPDKPLAAAEAASRMHTLALLYFPELAPAMDAYRDATRAYQQVLEIAIPADAVPALARFADARKTALEAIEADASRYTSG